MTTVIYTAILGGSDTLKAAPVDVADQCVCFTDAPLELHDRPDGTRSSVQVPKQSGWQIATVPATTDPRRNAWWLRARSDLLFPDADVVLWLDASFDMIDVAALLRDAGDAELAGLRHHERASCYEEGAELVGIGQSRAEDVAVQLEKYRREGFAPTALTTSGILLRRRTTRTKAFNELWDYETRLHRGDNTQLSLDYAAWKVGLPITHLQGTYPDNPYVRYDAEDHHLHRRPYR